MSVIPHAVYSADQSYTVQLEDALWPSHMAAYAAWAVCVDKNSAHKMAFFMLGLRGLGSLRGNLRSLGGLWGQPGSTV